MSLPSEMCLVRTVLVLWIMWLQRVERKKKVLSPPDILCFYRMWWRQLLLRHEGPAPTASRHPLQPPALPLPLPHSCGKQPQWQPHDGPQPCHCVWAQCLSVSRKPCSSVDSNHSTYICMYVYSHLCPWFTNLFYRLQIKTQGYLI